MHEQWYLDENFWRTFGPLMFTEASFAEAAEQVQQFVEMLPADADQALDLGCGPGRHALALAKLGFQVTAVDTSRQLLDELEQRRGPLPIEIVQADMRHFERHKAFDLILIMWTSFGYFEDEADHAAVLERVRASLSSSGVLVLDVVGLEYLARSLEPVHLSETDDGRLLIERPLLTDSMRRLDNEWLLIDGDRVRRARFSHRVWSAGELSQLLRAHGLEPIGIHGGYDGRDYDLDAERLIVIARRSQ